MATVEIMKEMELQDILKLSTQVPLAQIRVDPKYLRLIDN